MPWIMLGIAVVGGIFLLLALSGGAARTMDKDASREARHLTTEEADEILHPPPKTEEEIAEDNLFYEER